MEVSQFELAYNVACARIGGGQFSQGFARELKQREYHV